MVFCVWLGKICMQRSILLTLVAFYALFVSCTTKKIFSPKDDSSQYIATGNGGGFTGKITKYYFLDNGEVYQDSELTNAFEKVAEVSENMVTQQWRAYAQFGLKYTNLNQPGNFYYILEFKQKNAQPHTFIWQELDETEHLIATIFQNLNNAVRLTQKNSK